MPVVITGNNTPTAGGVTYGDGSTYANTAAGTSGQPLVSGGAGAPAFRPYTLPATDGSANQLLQTNGSGALSFATVSAGFTLGTPVASTSGTFIDFLSIPAGTKQIVISFSGVSTSGTTTPLFQLGDAGGIENTGYSSLSFKIRDSATSLGNTTTDGFNIYSDVAAAIINGSIIMTLENSATFTWIVQGSFSVQTGAFYGLITSGKKTLSQELDRVRITTVSGADTFDAGEINIAYI